MFTGSPGLPEIEEIEAPGILPTKAWSIEAEGAAGNLSAVTDSTEIPNFLLLVATPEPVTTTSDNDFTSVANFTVTFAAAATVFDSYPRADTTNEAPLAAFTVNDPSGLTVAPTLVPFT